MNVLIVNTNKDGAVMRACATAGGGVMFIPDQLERVKAKTPQNKPISYKDLVKDEPMVLQLELEEDQPLTALERLEKFAEKVKKIKGVA